MTRQIVLSNGAHAIVDESDHERLHFGAFARPNFPQVEGGVERPDKLSPPAMLSPTAHPAPSLRETV